MKEIKLTEKKAKDINDMLVNSTDPLMKHVASMLGLGE